MKDKTVKNSTRQSNIELLRIVIMMGVIVLHYNYRDNGGGFAVAEGINLYILYFLECVCISAVNLFVLITGYFMCKDNKRSLIKPIKMIIQVMFFSCALYLFDVLTGSRTFSVVCLVRRMVPTNYFVILYITLYIISPYVNKLLVTLNLGQLKRMLTIMFFCSRFGRPWLTFPEN